MTEHAGRQPRRSNRPCDELLVELLYACLEACDLVIEEHGPECACPVCYNAKYGLCYQLEAFASIMAAELVGGPRDLEEAGKERVWAETCQPAALVERRVG